MKPADPNRDYRPLVRDGYNRVSSVFNSERSGQSADELRPLLDVLPDGSTMLDLGCGSGAPVTRALAQSHHVVGVDISSAQLELARNQVPEAQFVLADISRVAFPPGTFDAVVSFYAIFHLPLTEHGPLIEWISGWLRPGGYLMATLSPLYEEGYTEDYFGTEMYWSNLGLPEYRALLQTSGFEVLQQSTIGHGYTNSDAKPEAHPLVFAQKTL